MMRNGYLIDVLTSLDFQELFKFGRKVIEIYEGVIYRQNFKKTPFTEIIEKFFVQKQNCKDEGNDLMQGLVILIENNLYSVRIRKDMNEFYQCKSEHWIQTEYDDSVLDYWKLRNGIFSVKRKKDDGLNGDNDVKNTLPSQFGGFKLSNYRRFVNNFIREINGFYCNSIYYGDTDSKYFEKKIMGCFGQSWFGWIETMPK